MFRDFVSWESFGDKGVAGSCLETKVSDMGVGQAVARVRVEHAPSGMHQMCNLEYAPHVGCPST
jgi:hypothetical protein